MKLKVLKMKNFLSWGNSVLTVNFEDYEGLKLLISGDNKQGKSTIVDAISFALFGKTIRPIKKEDYINYINKRDLYVELTIETVTGEIMVCKKTQKTPTYNIEEEWTIDDIPVTQLSTKILTLEKVCNDYYGFNYDEFKNSVALTTFNTNIMEKGKDEKRKFFENMFKITDISNIKKIISEYLTTTVTNKNNLETNLKSSEAVKVVILENIEKIESIKNNIVKDGQDEVNRLRKLIKDNNEKVLPLSNKFLKLKDDIKTNEVEHTKLEKRYSKLQYNVGFLTDRKKFLTESSGKDEKCPHCGSKLTDEHIEITVSKIEEKLLDFDKKLSEINVKESKNRLTNDKKDAREIETQINKIHTENEQYEKQVTTTQDKIAKQLKDLDLKEQQKKLKAVEKKISDCNVTLSELNDDITKYEFILNNVLHDDGLRHFILSHYIDFINVMLAENVKKLNLDFELVMDNSMNIDIQKLGMTINYWGLSLGERTLLNTIILFVIVKLRKLTNTNFIDLLIVDEFLDTGLSPESIELVLNLIDDLFGNTSIIMVSHKLADQYDYFDNIFRISKVGSFSQLDIVK